MTAVPEGTDRPTAFLLDLLDLTATGADRFTAVTPDEGPGRLFGGQVASQSLRAATLTVGADRRVHSLHAYFIRPGRPGVPLVLDVERTRDGRSFATRVVHASQHGEAIFTMAASFHIAEDGDDWQPPAAAVPGPDDVDDRGEVLSQFVPVSPFEIRMVHRPEPGGLPIQHPFWVRTRDRLPDDPALHACAITFVSDMAVVGGAFAPGTARPGRGGATLDHAVWFHRPARADEWLLFDVGPASNFGARGLALGTMHTATGVLVASIAQEAVLRGTGGPTGPAIDRPS